MVLLLLSTLGIGVCLVVSSPTQAATASASVPTLSDDFGHDTSLNTSLWQINGSVGYAFGGRNCPSCSSVQLAPSFSSSGMEIAQINGSAEVGTIQSVESFAPPLTVTALVEGIVSDGHPFVFGISSANATYGVQITGNLNPDDCSNETNCGNPATCGNPANPSIAPSQCFYGIYARTGTGGSGNWPKTPQLNLSPSVAVVYSLQISVGISGNAQFGVSQGGHALGNSTVQLGAGPFYIILAQSEGAPVPGPGSNEAVWMSVSLTPSSTVPGAASSSSAPINWTVIALLILVVLVALLLALAWSRRRRDLTVTVLDAGTLSPVTGAGVWADGPKNLSGNTRYDGKVAFGGVKAGNYSVKASATGYVSPVPAKVSVKGSTELTVRLDRTMAGMPTVDASHAAPAAPGPPSVQPLTVGAAPVAPVAVPGEPLPERGPAPSGPPVTEGMEGWGGERIRQIIQTFRAKGAISPETALSAEELGLSRMFVRIMKRRRGQTRVFMEVNGRYYLNETALQERK